MLIVKNWNCYMNILKKCLCKSSLEKNHFRFSLSVKFNKYSVIVKIRSSYNTDYAACFLFNNMSWMFLMLLFIMVFEFSIVQMHSNWFTESLHEQFWNVSSFFTVANNAAIDELCIETLQGGHSFWLIKSLELSRISKMQLCL